MTAAAAMTQHPISREDLQRILGFRVQNIDVYRTAFVHKSYLKEQPDLADSYERLEYLGDSVINFVVGKYLFDRFPGKREGFLTRVRTKIVSGKCLHTFSRNLGIQQFILMDQKAIRNGWNHNERILEDVFESLVGAIYLDLGLLAARDFVISTVESNVDFAQILQDTNYKDILMRYTQARGIPLPDYKSSELRTSSNERVFRIHTYVGNTLCGTGTAGNKKEAEQQAAQQAIAKLGVPFDQEIT